MNTFRSCTSFVLLSTYLLLAGVSSYPQPAGETALDDNNDDIGYLLAKRKGFDSLSGYTFGKRNFDELDRSRFSAFAKRAFQKRNFDEIDRARFGAFHKKNFDELDRARFGAFHKRNFDELDRSRLELSTRETLMKLTRSGSELSIDILNELLRK